MASREALVNQLKQHRAWNEHEFQMTKAVIEFIEQHPDCFERSQKKGHITGSAWVVSAERSHTLLTHHAKLNKWLQMGGHCDGDADVLRVAIREAEEESGLRVFRPVTDRIFDVDAHVIPARGAEPEHIHYDIRYLLEADRAEALTLSEESKDLAWVPLEEVARLNTDESVLRMVERTRALVD